MTPTALMSRDRSQFDNFLFAPLGEDRNGLPLSVVSALARLDRDPWKEAEILARLPAETAVLQLTSLLLELPVESTIDPDRGAIATRLIALLPRWTSAGVRISETPGIPAEAAQFLLSANAILFAILMFMWLVSQFIIARHESARQADPEHAPTTIAPSSRAPPPSSGE